MELIIAILIALGVITSPAEYQDHHQTDFQTEIDNSVINDELDMM